LGTAELIRYGVTGDNQPELLKFVRDVAEWRGVPVPQRVELSPLPDIVASEGRLVLGLPVLYRLDAQELAEAVGHELLGAGTRSRELAPVGGPPGMEPEPCAVAAVLLGAAEIAIQFERFVLRYVGPLAASGYYPADLWDGWRAAAPRGAGRPVPLRSLGLAAEAGFARLLAAEFRAGVPLGELRPVTFDEVPQEVWDAALSRRAAGLRAAAALLLHRPRATGAEVADLVVRDGRAAELLRLAGAESPDLDPAPRALTPLLHEALRARGYRFTDPLDQDVYIGPSWDHLDLTNLLAAPTLHDLLS
jgi:hypothetical protein